jgi:hypothetical protein
VVQISGGTSIQAKALRIGRSSAQRRRNQKWLLAKKIFLDISTRRGICSKMLRHW